MLRHPAKHIPYLLHMLLQGLPPYQHVVHVEEAVVKALACIPQPKWHADKLPQPKKSDDSCLVHVTWVDRFLVEALGEIQLGEDGEPLHWWSDRQCWGTCRGQAASED